VVAQHVGEEVAVDLVAAGDCGLDHRLQGELVDGPGLALADLEDGPDGGLREELGRDGCPVEVVADVLTGIVDAEGS